jgi:hypothetical protein
MSFYNEPFALGNPHSKELITIALKGFDDKPPMQAFVESLGIARIDINWDRAIKDIWPDALIVIARQGKLRAFMLAAKAEPTFASMSEQIESLLAICDNEVSSEEGESAVDHTLATVIGRRPFVNRIHLRDNLRSLFGNAGDRTMIVGGPPASGRSYTWVLLSHVARMTGGFDVRLIDLSTFKDTQATPADVVRMIAASFEWGDTTANGAAVDPTAQDETNARVLRIGLAAKLSRLGPVCLVFDGLDGANVTEATVNFVGDLAAAAGNGEIGDCRVVLLAFNRALPNPMVDPFVLREPPLADIPLSDLMVYLQSVATQASNQLSVEQAQELAEGLFGRPLRDPVPISVLGTKAAEVSKVVCKLRGD